MWLYRRVMSPNGVDGMANSVEPDQTAPLGSSSSLSSVEQIRRLSDDN